MISELLSSSEVKSKYVEVTQKFSAFSENVNFIGKTLLRIMSLVVGPEGICGKYFLSFSKKKLSREKLTQLKAEQFCKTLISGC